MLLAGVLLVFPLGAFDSVHALEDAKTPSVIVLSPIQSDIKNYEPQPPQEKQELPANAEALPKVLPDAEKTVEAWNMVLVNEWNPLPEDFTVELVSLAGGWQVDCRIQQPLTQMIQDAAAQGVNLLISSSYRSVDYQSTLYQRKVQYYQNCGLTLESAQEQARQWVARPRRSEHHTGLAVDITTLSYQVLDSGFGGTDAAKWMLEHSAEYGFILRYPEGKTEITGVCWEPWHFRYVGEEAAKQIMQEGICLEEYLDRQAQKGESVPEGKTMESSGEADD